MAAEAIMSSDALILGNPTDAELSDQLLSPAWTPKHKLWGLAFTITGAGACMLFFFAGWSIVTGIGLWGNNVPVGWAFDIINFVWWIGIGHAGTFISAVLLLLEQKWRTSINRFAEAMTLFAVMQAGLFPLLHMGRPWFGYWIFPYPATMKTWPNFKSALPWDAAAISTYFTVSLLFWYIGLIPDLASLRDRAPKKIQRVIYGIFALGWRGSADHYRHYRLIYGMFAGLATPLVLSVHSIVSCDFATSVVPGWHSTIFPPYFVAGAIFSGFAMVLTLMIPARKIFSMENVITMKHVDNLCKMILVTGLIVTYSYFCDFFVAWYGGEAPELYTMMDALLFRKGPHWEIFYLSVFCNCIVPNMFWFRWFRQNLYVVWGISILVNVGMWGERFSIIVLSLQRDFLPSAWATYNPTYVDWGIFTGTIFFFSFLFILFLRFVPFVPLMEVKELKHEMHHHQESH